MKSRANSSRYLDQNRLAPPSVRPQADQPDSRGSDRVTLPNSAGQAPPQVPVPVLANQLHRFLPQYFPGHPHIQGPSRFHIPPNIPGLCHIQYPPHIQILTQGESPYQEYPDPRFPAGHYPGGLFIPGGFTILGTHFDVNPTANPIGLHRDHHLSHAGLPSFTFGEAVGEVNFRNRLQRQLQVSVDRAQKEFEKENPGQDWVFPDAFVMEQQEAQKRREAVIRRARENATGVAREPDQFVSERFQVISNLHREQFVDDGSNHWDVPGIDPIGPVFPADPTLPGATHTPRPGDPTPGGVSGRVNGQYRDAIRSGQEFVNIDIPAINQLSAPGHAVPNPPVQGLAPVLRHAGPRGMVEQPHDPKWGFPPDQIDMVNWQAAAWTVSSESPLNYDPMGRLAPNPDMPGPRPAGRPSGAKIPKISGPSRGPSCVTASRNPQMQIARGFGGPHNLQFPPGQAPRGPLHARQQLHGPYEDPFHTPMQPNPFFVPQYSPDRPIPRPAGNMAQVHAANRTQQDSTSQARTTIRTRQGNTTQAHNINPTQLPAQQLAHQPGRRPASQPARRPDAPDDSLFSAAFDSYLAGRTFDRIYDDNWVNDRRNAEVLQAAADEASARTGYYPEGTGMSSHAIQDDGYDTRWEVLYAEQRREIGDEARKEQNKLTKESTTEKKQDQGQVQGQTQAPARAQAQGQTQAQAQAQGQSQGQGQGQCHGDPMEIDTETGPPNGQATRSTTVA